MANPKISRIAKSWRAFLRSLRDLKTESPDKDITSLIFHDLFRIRQFQWEHKEKFHREKNAPISDIFQDLIAHYIKIALKEYEKEYEIICEFKCERKQVDILIRNQKGENIAAIETKTNLCWNRDLPSIDKMNNRRNELSRELGIKKNSFFYIAETAKTAKKCPEGFYPLFDSDPNSIILDYRRKNNNKLKNFSDKEIDDYYKENKLGEDLFSNKIVKKIKEAGQKLNISNQDSPF